MANLISVVTKIEKQENNKFEVYFKDINEMSLNEINSWYLNSGSKKIRIITSENIVSENIVYGNTRRVDIK